MIRFDPQYLNLVPFYLVVKNLGLEIRVSGSTLTF